MIGAHIAMDGHLILVEIGPMEGPELGDMVGDTVEGKLATY